MKSPYDSWGLPLGGSNSDPRGNSGGGSGGSGSGSSGSGSSGSGSGSSGNNNNTNNMATIRLGVRQLNLATSYTGFIYDQVLNIYFAQARMYDPSIRRFLAVDPVRGNIFNPQLMVQYTFVLNNPLRWVDPLGLSPHYVCLEEFVNQAGGSFSGWGGGNTATVTIGGQEVEISDDILMGSDGSVMLSDLEWMLNHIDNSWMDDLCDHEFESIMNNVLGAGGSGGASAMLRALVDARGVHAGVVAAHEERQREISGFAHNSVNRQSPAPQSLRQMQIDAAISGHTQSPFNTASGTAPNSVLVGLRSFAETFPGSTVVWCPIQGRATIWYNGAHFTVLSTPDNNRNGRIYVNDADVIAALGMGSRPIVVYHNTTDNNVSIRANFNFVEPMTVWDDWGNVITFGENRIPHNLFGGRGELTYAQVFMQGVQEHWSGGFGPYSVVTHVGERQYGAVNVSIQGGRGVPIHTEIFWAQHRPGVITMYQGHIEHYRGLLYSPRQYRETAAHEFGHLLGLEDFVRTDANREIVSVMNVPGMPVYQRDIEAVLRVWSGGRPFQPWPY